MKSLRNALQIVEEIAARQPIGVGELARTLGLPKTNVQRALTTLREVGWLWQVNDGSARWGLTARVLALGRGSAHQTLRTLSLPIMTQLRAETEESIALFVRDGDHAVAIEGLDGLKSVRTNTDIGTRAPLHASASGKAILATLPDDELEAYIGTGLESYTEATITDGPSLRAELARVRKRGYAIHRGEWMYGVAAVGAAIRGTDGVAEGAIVIAAPAERLPPNRVGQLGQRISAAAHQISFPSD